MLFSCVQSQNMPLFCLLRRSGGFAWVYIRLWAVFALWAFYGLLWHVTIKQAASIVAVFPSVRIFADLRRFSRVPCMCPFFAVFRFYGRSAAYGGISWFPALCSACVFRMLSGLCRVSVFLCSVRGTFGSFPALCPWWLAVAVCRSAFRLAVYGVRSGCPACRVWWCGLSGFPCRFRSAVIMSTWSGRLRFPARQMVGSVRTVRSCRPSPGFRQTAETSFPAL